MQSIRTIIFFLFLTTPALISNAGNIEPGGYILVGGGFSQTSDPSLFTDSKTNSQKIKFFPSAMFNANLGYKINRFFRTDLNIQYRQIKIKSPADLKQLRLTNYIGTINGYLDLDNYSSLTPYVTAGVGASSLHIKKNNDNTTIQSSDSIGITFNMGIGAQFQINNDFGIDLVYKYVDLGKLKATDSTSITQSPNIGAHEILFNFLILL